MADDPRSMSPRTAGGDEFERDDGRTTRTRARARSGGPAAVPARRWRRRRGRRDRRAPRRVPGPGTPTARPGRPAPGQLLDAELSPAGCQPSRSTGGTRPGSCPSRPPRRCLVRRDRGRPGRADRPAADHHRPGPVPDRRAAPAAGRHRRSALRLRGARADRGPGRPHRHGRRRILAVRRPLRAGRPQPAGLARCSRSPTTTSTRPSAAATSACSCAPGIQTRCCTRCATSPGTPGAACRPVAHRRLRQPGPPGRHHAAQPAWASWTASPTRRRPSTKR